MDEEQFIQAELTRLRFDANETSILSDQLRYVKAKTYDIEYAALKARQFIPVSNEIPEGAETMEWREWDTVGAAKLISNYADDLPLVDAFSKPNQSRIQSLGDGYQYSIQDLRRAAMAGERIDARRARAARDAVELKIDQIAASGAEEAGLYGFLNHPNVPLVSPTTGTWSGASPTQIRADISKLARSIVSVTKERHQPDTLLLPTDTYGLLSDTPLASDNQTSVLNSILQNSPWIKNIDMWEKLETAGVGGTRRIVAYKRDPDVLTLEIPKEFEQLPPQARNLAFIIPCHARIGGVVIYRPLAIAYMDGV
jgi:hypothetical protein